MRRTLTGATLAALGVLAPASALAEPPLPPATQAPAPFPTRWQDAVLRSVADQRTLGLTPCEPTFADLPADLEAKGVVADAADTYTFGYCEVRWMTGDLPSSQVPAIAWHEVCHLSTAPHITSHPAEHRGEDPYHSHESFLACLRLGPQGWATTDYLP